MQREILVTGGNSGIGLEMVRHFLRRGHRVVIAARTAAKNRAVEAMLRDEIPGADVSSVTLDLGNFSKTDQAAAEILKALPRLDTVMVNAGSFTNGLRLDDNGLEAMIGTMHFGHFRLMQHLLPRLLHASAPRVVVTSSMVHWIGSIDPASFRDPSRHRVDIKSYAQAKLANLLYARELARRHGDDGLLANAFHPGAVATGIWRELPRPVQAVVDRALITPERGADTGIWLALDTEAAKHSGDYLIRRRKARNLKASRNMRLAAKLWELSEEIAGID